MPNNLQSFPNHLKKLQQRLAFLARRNLPNNHWFPGSERRCLASCRSDVRRNEVINMQQACRILENRNLKLKRDKVLIHKELRDTLPSFLK